MSSDIIEHSTFSFDQAQFHQNLLCLKRGLTIISEIVHDIFLNIIVFSSDFHFSILNSLLVKYFNLFLQKKKTLKASPFLVAAFKKDSFKFRKIKANVLLSYFNTILSFLSYFL